MIAKKKTDPVESRFLGLWRITEMPDFDLDDVNEDEPARVEFEAKGTGCFQFACVHGELDVRYTRRAGKPCAEFAWMGNDEEDDACGRGIAWIGENGMMTGTIFVYQGDEHDFVAKKKGEKKPRGKRV